MMPENLPNRILPGVLMVAVFAIPAWLFGKAIPLIGGPVFGILIGIVIAFWKRPALFNAGITFTAKKLLQTAIILLGFEMNLFNVLTVGSQSLSIMFFTISAALLTAWFFGRHVELPQNISILIGVGTAICGGSAIAATAPIIKASEKEITYSISTIFLFNIVAVFIFPALGHLLAMSDAGFGMWAGTAINDTSSVVAAGYSYSNEAGNFATIVKLTRTLMIVPIALALTVWVSQKQKAMSGSVSITKVFPWFIVGFLATCIIGTTGLIPVSVCQALTLAGKFLIVMAMTAIGLNTHLGSLLANGIKPVLLGLICWLAVATVSLIIQYHYNLW